MNEIPIVWDGTMGCPSASACSQLSRPQLYVSANQLSGRKTKYHISWAHKNAEGKQNLFGATSGCHPQPEAAIQFHPQIGVN